MEDDQEHETRFKAAENSLFETIKTAAEHNPRLLARVLCNGVIADPTSEASLLIGRTGEGIRRKFSWPAQALARFLEQEVFDRHAAAYFPVRDWIERDFASRWRTTCSMSFKLPSIEHVLETFFEPLIYASQLSAALATQFVYHGLPLFERKNGEYQPANEQSEEMAYLRYRGRNVEVLDSWDAPSWADKYYICEAHFATYTTFFKAHWDHSADEIEQLRTAYRIAIGMPISATQSRAAIQVKQSTLLTLVDKVIGRYYGQNFIDIDSSTWPRQKDIVAWLKETEGLSEREAQAIDIVCRPDALRGKS